MAEYDLIATEELAVRNMSASARGTLEEPGRNVTHVEGQFTGAVRRHPALRGVALA